MSIEEVPTVTQSIPLGPSEERTEEVATVIKPVALGPSMERIEEVPTVTQSVTIEQIEEVPTVTQPVTHGPSKERKLLLMLSCLYLQFASVGMTISLGVIYVELIDAFDALRSEAALIQSLYMGLSIAGGVIFSKIIHRFDVGICVICSSVIGTFCLIASAFAWNLTMIVVLVGGVLGLSQSLSLIASYAVINWTFKTSRKSALAFLTIGQAVSQVSVPFITEVLVYEYSWNGAFLILSALMSFQGIPMGLQLYMSGNHFANHYRKEAQQESESSPFYKDIPFILYVIGHVLCNAIAPVELWFGVDLAVMKGFSTNDGATLLSVNGISSLIGSISGTFILRKYTKLGPELFMAASALLWGITHAWIVSSNVFWLMVIGMIFRGVLLGQVIAFIPAIQIELRGSHQYPQTMALVGVVSGTSQIVGGYLGGYTADVTGGYDLIFYLACGTSVCSSVCMVVVYILRKRNEKQKSNEIMIG